MRIVHIDGDIIAYSVGFASNDDPPAFAIHSAKKLLERVIEETEADDYIVHMTGPTNFRDELATLQGYKENRRGTEKPVHHKKIRDWLIKKHPSDVSKNCEADDTMGIAATADDEHTHIIASLDKDLNMIAGWHYNWRKEELYYMEPDEADNCFVLQLLTGDSTDNIPGLKRITGKVASKKIKEWCLEPELFHEKVDRVREVYTEHGDGLEVDMILHEIGNLLWMRRTGYDVWEAYYEACRQEAESSKD